jgi:RNA polymerase sigma-B factor
MTATNTQPMATSHRPGAPSSATDEARLFARQQGGDLAARDALVRRFMPLARSLARRYDRSSEPFEDLLQVASLGLLKAIDRFDPQMGHPFASFAVPTILGEMRRHFRDAGWSVHVPRGSQERALKVRDAQERLANERGRAPTVNELGQFLELSTEEVIDALQAIQAYESLSLDAPRPGATDEVTSYGDSMGEEDARYELVELDATISAVLGRIPQRERQILSMRFVEDLTQTEIAERVGISQMQVSRLLRRSLDQLRTMANAST